MNLSPFKRDINELIDEFVKGNSMTFDDMKRVWISRKFSYIYEACPRTNLAFFMQSLYAFAIGHMVSTDSLSERLGGLYCLYCLHETQPFKPKFRIYISVQELGKLRDLVKEAKEKGVEVAAVIVKQMLEKNMFIYGSVDLKESSAAEKINEATELQNRFVQVAYKKIFANSPIEKFIHLDLGKAVDLDAISKMSKEYAEAKNRVIGEGSKVAEMGDIKHISEEKVLLGERLGKLKEEWDEQKQSFYEQTNHAIDPTEIEPSKEQGGEEKQLVQEHDDDDGFDEVERLIFQS